MLRVLSSPGQLLEKDEAAREGMLDVHAVRPCVIIYFIDYGDMASILV